MREMIDEIVAREWEQFQLVNNYGGRADCQDNWNTFRIMRTSQFLCWPSNLLESYLKDVKTAQEEDHNLIFNKYAYMMEVTDPEGYSRICHILPQIPYAWKVRMEEIVQIQVEWAAEFAREYPNYSGKGRPIHQYEERPGWTSVETYQRGELYSYSLETQQLYCEFIEKCKKEKRNLTYEVRENMAKMYGYDSLEHAERSMKC